MKKILLIFSFFLFVPSAFAYTITVDSGTDAIGQTFGRNDSSSDQVAEQFTTVGAGTVSDVKVFVTFCGTLVDHVVFGIYSDNGSNLPNVQIGSVSNNYDPTDLGEDCGGSSPGSQTTVTFPTPPSVSASTKYWVVYKRSGALNNTNYYDLNEGTTAAHGGGVSAALAGSTWNTLNKGINLVVDISPVAVVSISRLNLWSYWW